MKCKRNRTQLHKGMRQLEKSIMVWMLLVVVSGSAVLTNPVAAYADLIEEEPMAPILPGMNPGADEEENTDTDMVIHQADGDNFSLEELSNMVNEEKELSFRIDGKSSENTTTLVVELTTPGDHLTLYKIGERIWDEESSSFLAMTWVPKVAEWVGYSTKYNSGNFSSPEDLATATKSVWDSFFEDMVLGENAVIVSENNTEGLKAYNCEQTTEELETTITGLTMGMYVIVATQGDDPMKPVVVNIEPTRASPNGSYYLPYRFSTSLKAAQVTVEKTITNHNRTGKSAMVQVSDVVEFDIMAKVPSLYELRITETNEEESDVKPYTMYLEDHMDDAFSYEEGSMEIGFHYINSEGQDRYGSFPEGMVEYVTYGDESTNSGDATVVPAGEVELHPALEGGYKFTKRDNIYHIYEEASASYDTPAEETDRVMRVEINMGALKEWLSNMDFRTITYLEMRYKAKVTNCVEYNSTDNYNRVYFYYESNSNGDVAYVKDEALAYTYGIRVVKMDGESYESGQPLYLDEAKFRLYKEIGHFDEEDVWVPEDTFDSSEEYVRSDYNNREGLFADMPCTAFKDHGNLRIFVLVDFGEGSFRGDFTATGTEEGFLIAGVGPGTYLLSEIQPKAGYSNLLEDMLFTIEGLKEEEANLGYEGKYLAFKEGDGTVNTTGVLLLEVLNYKGFTLPTTGATGTLMFTMFGLILMIFTMVLLLVKRNNEAYQDLF